jgi:hypothetical protein
MNRIDLYNKTVDILFQAYFNDTLEHGNYCGCAVGNLVAAGMGKKIIRSSGQVDWLNDLDGGSLWYDLIRGYIEYGGNEEREAATAQILSTGYSFDEITMIERSFEKAPFGNSQDDYMFNGLVSVLEALKQIHEIKDEHVTEVSRKRFADHYATK